MGGWEGRTGGAVGVGERGWGSMLMPVYGEISTLIQSLLAFSVDALRKDFVGSLLENLCPRPCVVNIGSTYITLMKMPQTCK